MAQVARDPALYLASSDQSADQPTCRRGGLADPGKFAVNNPRDPMRGSPQPCAMAENQHHFSQLVPPSALLQALVQERDWHQPHTAFAKHAAIGPQIRAPSSRLESKPRFRLHVSVSWSGSRYQPAAIYSRIAWASISASAIRRLTTSPMEIIPVSLPL